MANMVVIVFNGASLANGLVFGVLGRGKDLHLCSRRSLSCTPRSRLEVERYNCPAAKAFRSVWLWTRSITAVPLRSTSVIVAPAARSIRTISI